MKSPKTMLLLQVFIELDILPNDMGLIKAMINGGKN
jgi:hypothetical protein